jgi:hypothetical protein
VIHVFSQGFVAVLAAFTLAVPSHAGGTGPGDEDKVQAWEYCMQESIKAVVWGSKLSGDAAVRVAYRDCKPDFYAALTSLPDAKAKAQFRSQVAKDHAMRKSFAIKMKSAGNPQQ